MHFTVGGVQAYAYTGSRARDGARPCVVFVHGAANDHSVFALQSRYFAYHGFDVLAIDLPGHGRSAGSPLRSVRAIADWIVALLDAAAVDRAALVGHSLGSLAALEAGARHPSRIAKIALLGPAIPMAVSDALLEAARRTPQSAREMMTAWSHSAPRQLGGNAFPGMWMTGGALALMERTRPDALEIDLRACNDYADGLDAASGVRCPALVVVAGRDLMAPPKATPLLVDALRDARVVTLAECGHAMMAEQPDAVLDALRSFL